MGMSELLQTWKRRLREYDAGRSLPKGLDSRVIMGIRQGRYVALKRCIKELTREMKKNDEARPAHPPETYLHTCGL